MLEETAEKNTNTYVAHYRSTKYNANKEKNMFDEIHIKRTKEAAGPIADAITKIVEKALHETNKKRRRSESNSPPASPHQTRLDTKRTPKEKTPRQRLYSNQQQEERTMDTNQTPSTKRQRTYPQDQQLENPQKTTFEITIAEAKIGQVIGKGKRHLKRWIEEDKVEAKLTRDINEEGDATLEVTGTRIKAQKVINNAKQLMLIENDKDQDRISRKDIPCRFDLRDSCKRGDECLYKHQERQATSRSPINRTLRDQNTRERRRQSTSRSPFSTSREPNTKERGRQSTSRSPLRTSRDQNTKERRRHSTSRSPFRTSRVSH